MNDLIEAQVRREQEWAYAQWLEHRSYRGMRQVAVRPPERGGLGYDLNESALRGLVAGYRETRGDIRGTRDEEIERELHGLDLVAATCLRSMARAAELGTINVHASKLLLEAGTRRSKLLGLDAPVEARLDVTVQDAATVELEAMLAEAGIENDARP